MKIKNMLKKFLPTVLCAAIILTAVLTATSCGGNESDKGTSSVASSESAESEPSDGYGTDAKDIGDGATSFIFRVTDASGIDTLFRVHTDKKTVGEALKEVDLIAGEESQYGLYVKTVNGITADYDKDKTFWGFYIYNAETQEYDMAPNGVDLTDVVADGEYCFRVVK